MKSAVPRGYWNPRAETLPREQLTEIQWRKLKTQLEHVYARSPFYRARLDEAGCPPDRIRSLGDYFSAVPVLSRGDILEAEAVSPPYGALAAVDPSHAVFHHQTSGSSGAPPVRTFDTMRDWTWVSDMFATGLYALGIRRSDRVAVVFGYGLFIGFWSGHYGLQRIGATVIATGGFDSEKRIQLMIEQDLTALLCTPTYALRLVLTAEKMGVDLARDTLVNIVVVSGEPRPVGTREKIAKAFDASVPEVAGMTEAGTLLMFECAEDPGGMHIIETDVIEEVLDPETRQPVDYGQRGVRVMTTLGREGIPMLRYWTNDLVIKVPHTECACGRTWDIYEGGILGRSDDMRKIRGVFFMPRMVEDVVRQFPEIDEFQTVLDTIDALDTLIIHIEPQPGVVDPEALRTRFAATAKRVLGTTPRVELAAPDSLPRFEMKASRFRDARTAPGGGS